MEAQKTLNNQNNLEQKELFQTDHNNRLLILPNKSNKNNMVDPHGTKHKNQYAHTHIHTHNYVMEKKLSNKLMKLHSSEF